MTRMRIELHSPGVKAAALTSPEVRAEVAKVAERIAAAARGRTENEIEVINAGKSRARSYVRMLGADAAREEAKERILGTAIDAGRS
jgi:hypothetical protein